MAFYPGHSVNLGRASALMLLLCPALLAAQVQTETPDQSSLEPERDYRQDPDRQRGLPGPATRLNVDGQVYYFSGGYYFRREDDGYLRVEPPLGAELSFVPSGSRAFEVDGQRYLVSGTGTFYRYNPRRNSYTITTPPYNWRRYYNGDVAGAYRDRLTSEDARELDALLEQERARIPKAYPPPATSGTAAEPRFEADGDRRPDQRAPDSRRPYAEIRPERYDDRALLENICRQQAAAEARRQSSLQRQQLRLYQRAYRDCIQRYQRRR